LDNAGIRNSNYGCFKPLPLSKEISYATHHPDLKQLVIATFFKMNLVLTQEDPKKK
jgi:hypothetical protein